MIREALASTSHDALSTVATIEAGYGYEYDDYLETRGLVYPLGGQPGAGTDVGSFISWAGTGSYTGSESGDLKALADFAVETMRSKGLVE